MKSSGAMGVSGVLSEREQTHGDYERSADLAQALKVRFRAELGATRLLPYQQEAVEMILFKLARIASGDCSHADHWRDIAGYATLVLERLVPTDVPRWSCGCPRDVNPCPCPIGRPRYSEQDDLSPDARYND